MMKGYYEAYSYVLIMPNGKRIRFATEQEAKEYFEGEEDSKDVSKNNCY